MVLHSPNCEMRMGVKNLKTKPTGEGQKIYILRGGVVLWES